MPSPTPRSRAWQADYYAKQWPGSLAVDYMNKTNWATSNSSVASPLNRYDVLCNLTKQRGLQSPLPPRDAAVIHLRLGDATDRSSNGTALFGEARGRGAGRGLVLFKCRFSVISSCND